MASLSDWRGSGLVKMLLLGESGAGKTGALASLANAGYNVRIIDLENKLGVLTNVLTTPGSPYDPAALGRVSAITISEPKKLLGGKVAVTKPEVWTKALTTLADWKDDKEALGSVTTWTSKDILVIDSLSALSKAALRQALALQGRLNQRAQLADWGVAQDLIEEFCEMINDASVGCHVIVIAHLAYIAPEGSPIEKGLPATLGKALSPKIGRYFDACLLAQSSGQGANTKRKILTANTGLVELKTTAPLEVRPEYDLATGLAEYFKAVTKSDPLAGATSAKETRS